MSHNEYTTEDFIKDDDFIRWVHEPDAKSNAYWQAFLVKYPEQKASIEEARAFIQVMQFKDASLDDISILKIKNAIDLGVLEDEQQSESESRDLKRKRLPFFRGTVFKVAASVALIAMVAISSWYWKYSAGDASFAEGITLPSNSEVITSEKGKRSVMVLADGTRVWLNADSKIAYRTDFTKGRTREVFLEGEAFFDVTENPEKPFIVNTSTVAVKVLGTAFNVKSFGNDAIVETTLVRGKVQIDTRNNSNDIILLPNQQAVFVKESKQVIVENQIEAEEYASWKSGKLYFKDKTFGAIVEELERWYNVDIHVSDDQSLECHFSAKFDNKPLEEVLELFKASGPSLDYRIEGSEIFITGELCEE